MTARGGSREGSLRPHVRCLSQCAWTLVFHLMRRPVVIFLLHRASSGAKARYTFQVGRFGSLLTPTPSSVTHQLREALTALFCRDNDSSRVQLDPTWEDQLPPGTISLEITWFYQASSEYAQFGIICCDWARVTRKTHSKKVSTNT